MAAPYAFRSVAFSCATLLTSHLAFLPAYAANTQQSGLQVLDPANVCGSWEWGGTPNAPTLTCVAAAAAGAPTCTTSATPNPVSASGGTVTLGVNCTGGTAQAWTTSLAGATISGNTMTVPANTGGSRAVVANVQACSTTTSVCATFSAQTTQSGVSAPPAPSPTGGFPSTCGNLAVIPFNKGSADLAYELRYDVTGMSGTTVAMGRFTTGAAGQDTAQFGLADVTGTNAAYRKMYVSASACDFAGAAGTAGPSLYPTFRYTVGANPPKLGYTNLQPNTTYYVMAKQESSAGSNCTTGGCGFSLVLHATQN